MSRNQEFRSTDLNAPPLNGLVGAIIACFQPLVTGYKFTAAPSSATRSGATITVTCTAAEIARLKVGSIATLSGATGGDASLYNVSHTVLTIPSTTTYTWLAAGTPTGSATGTLALTTVLPVTSITRGGVGNLTATMILVHANVTLRAGDWITIEGCSGTGNTIYNSTHQLTGASTTSAITTVTFQMPSDPGANASGSPTYYKSSMGWSYAAAAGTNSQSYVSTDTVGEVGDTYVPRPFQIVDNAATAGLGKEAQMWGYESITSDQTGSGLFPTVAQMASGACLRKSVSADSTNRQYTLAGDGKGFLWAAHDGSTTTTFHYGCRYGYVIPTRAGDQYNTMLAAGVTFNSVLAAAVQGGFIVAALGATPSQLTHACWMPRLYNQAGTSVVCAIVGVGAAGTVGSATGGGVLTYPHPPDNGLVLQTLWIADGAGQTRGRIPGTFGPMHVIPMAQWDTQDSPTGLSGRTVRGVLVSSGATHGQIFYDVTGPWD